MAGASEGVDRVQDGKERQGPDDQRSLRSFTSVKKFSMAPPLLAWTHDVAQPARPRVIVPKDIIPSPAQRDARIRPRNQQREVQSESQRSRELLPLPVARLELLGEVEEEVARVQVVLDALERRFSAHESRHGGGRVGVELWADFPFHMVECRFLWCGHGAEERGVVVCCATNLPLCLHRRLNLGSSLGGSWSSARGDAALTLQLTRLYCTVPRRSLKLATTNLH